MTPDPRAHAYGPRYAFDVYGTPAAQGSKRHVGSGVMVESSPHLRPWRAAVAAEAAQVAPETPLDGAVCVSVSFRFPVPKSRAKAAQEQGRLLKTTAPDVDKLLRGLLDGLAEGGLISNDARVAVTVAEKLEVSGWTGAAVTVWETER
jgi:crossover junction endodeoxyribonuclease RusA